MQEYKEESPVNPLPVAVVVLAIAIVLIELALQAGTRGLIGGADAVGWRLSLSQRFGLSGNLMQYYFETGRVTAEVLSRFLTYSFIHVGFGHAAMATVFLLALGKMVGETFGNIAVLLVFFISAIVGAAVYAVLIDSPAALIGGYPAVYGLIGSYTFMLWLSLGAAGKSRLSAFQLIAFLLGIQLVFGMLFGGGYAWIAEIAGFATGFLLSFALVPGAIARIRSRLQQR